MPLETGHFFLPHSPIIFASHIGMPTDRISNRFFIFGISGSYFRHGVRDSAQTDECGQSDRLMFVSARAKRPILIS